MRMHIIPGACKTHPSPSKHHTQHSSNRYFSPEMFLCLLLAKSWRMIRIIKVLRGLGKWGWILVIGRVSIYWGGCCPRTNLRKACESGFCAMGWVRAGFLTRSPGIAKFPSEGYAGNLWIPTTCQKGSIWGLLTILLSVNVFSRYICSVLVDQLQTQPTQPFPSDLGLFFLSFSNWPAH